MEEQLIEIRCPFFIKYKKVGGKYYPYNKVHNAVCAKVYKPARGEAWCHYCKLAFEYEVIDQTHISTSVKVKRS